MAPATGFARSRNNSTARRRDSGGYAGSTGTSFSATPVASGVRERGRRRRGRPSQRRPARGVFLTTKVWTDGYDSTRRSIDASLRELRSDYVDLLLIHQPGRDDRGTYRAMEDAHRAGKARAIGLSNFYTADFSAVADSCSVIPAVNQVETHVFWQQRGTREFLAPYRTQLESWAPFAEGKRGTFTQPVLRRIGEQHGKTVAQTILRFLIQGGVVVVPKTTHRDRMVENLDVFDFDLSHDEMAQIVALDSETHLGQQLIV